ncbi:flavin-containing monooxygenase [Aldersonia kunmingensis]|uniref:flavin-containing monooxygenase n=1 Tax=Aldersonia kunmingensis TaxID=408066 RepID=UPI000832B14E|nr:NAD(P)/FAD-dependent oxidoreductase [Aldersonia kunmingensis]
MESHDVVVIGGGQAGLVASHTLTERAIDHVVLEGASVAERWRSARWDSLRFQFPNTYLGLPGMAFDGTEPDGFAHHREVVQWLERYADCVGAPIREQTRVTSLDRDGDHWRVRTDEGDMRARVVVLATGPFQVPRLPDAWKALPSTIFQIHAMDYRSPELLPDGAVLVVGSGASGAQITEELLGVGRTTYTCVSRHRRVPRRFLDQDIFTWLVQIGVMDRTRADWVDGRMPPTVLVTGIGGGHDMNLRTLEQQGATLLGSLRGVSDGALRLADDADAILDAADAMCDETMRAVGRYATAEGFDVPMPEPSPPRHTHIYPSSLSLGNAGISTVIWATGYSFDYDWVHAPCFGVDGEPIQQRGIGQVEGLYFLGLHWMHTFKSGTFFGVGADAAHIVDHLVEHALVDKRTPSAAS